MFVICVVLMMGAAPYQATKIAKERVAQACHGCADRRGESCGARLVESCDEARSRQHQRVLWRDEEREIHEREKDAIECRLS
jgi:Fe-S-cluster-containing dehydrogenase component